MNKAVSAVAILALSGVATAQNLPYYITSGDQSVMYHVQFGAVQNVVSTTFLDYPLAVRNTIWLGNRDDGGATEYNLDGTLTGNTSAGGFGFSQLLDGAAGNNNLNYGIECCGGTNSVTVGNADWSGQSALFTLPNNTNGEGIAYDTLNDHIYVIDFNGDFFRMSTGGNVLFQSNHGYGGSLASLAYDVSSGTLWGYLRGTDDIINLALDGSTIGAVNVPGLSGVGNAFGGEMAIPAPGAAALLGVGGLIAGRRRR
jgi:MYXO-CTERM domain-containing protein